MNKNEVIQTIKETGVVPVVRAASAEEAVAAIEAIRAGGIAILEITMTVPGAVRLIEQVVGRYGGEALVGAGTVLGAETARACISSGAQFIVSPTLDLPTVDYCREQDVAVLPGALTPTEVVQAWKAGADMVKVFPCGAMGGRVTSNRSRHPFRRSSWCRLVGCRSKRQPRSSRRGPPHWESARTWWISGPSAQARRT